MTETAGQGPIYHGSGALNEGQLRQELAKAGIHATDELIAKAKQHVDNLTGEAMLGGWYFLFGSNFVLVVSDF